MNVSPADINLHVRTLRSRSIPYDIRQRQTDNQTSQRQTPNIPSRPNSLERSSKVMTSDISTHLSSNKDVTICSTFVQECYLPQPQDMRDTSDKTNQVFYSHRHFHMIKT